MILLTTGGSGVSTYADYNDPNAVFLDIQNQANGTTIAAFRYKTNSPTANGFFYGAGTLGFVSAPTAIGTWSMTLDNAGNARLDDAHRTLIERDCARDTDCRGQRTGLSFGCAQAQVLYFARIDGYDTFGVASPARILGHELHVHERRFAGFIEVLVRHHRVVPIQSLLFGGRQRTGSTGHRRICRVMHHEPRSCNTDRKTCGGRENDGNRSHD